MKILTGITISFIILLAACKKDSYITSPEARVTITADTIRYDTVFTSAGSITQVFKIINENSQKLLVSSVLLKGGVSSYYSINADGFTGPVINNLEIAANDSAYVFVQVNIDPNADNIPFVIKDSIIVSYNGTDKKVQLEAWGQNAHFMRDKEITSNETWNNDLPYVILGYLYVNPGSTLTINKGSRIYTHANAPIIVDGTLKVNGEKDTAGRVYFRGDRLDDPYKDYPASWPGIYFREPSVNNVFNYTVIKNAYQSIALEKPATNANPKLTLNECIIDNSYDAGIVSINSSVKATNCLISNCGKNLVLAQGGSYDFTHCTVASFSNNYILHKEPVLYLSNYILDNNTPIPADLTAAFTNCIFWGDNETTVEDEVVVTKSGTTLFNVNFESNLWKVKNNPADVVLNNIIANQAPEFDSINTARQFYNFRLKDISPAINKGANTSVVIDLDGNTRPVNLPDLGCFEKQ